MGNNAKKLCILVTKQHPKIITDTFNFVGQRLQQPKRLHHGTARVGICTNFQDVEASWSRKIIPLSSPTKYLEEN
jgi:hypothetical protein